MEVKRGVFYGVSVGPGDPELLTLKALRVLEACSVIAAPQTGSGDTLAMDIVRQAVSLEGKPLLPLPFTMAQDPALRQEAHQRAAWEIENFLAAGRDVAMLNLGDVSIYATYGYLQKLLKARGYQTEMIPGVSSFCAAAARLGVDLVQGDEPLHLIPGHSGPVEEALALPGTKVLMKSGRQFPKAVWALERAGLAERASLVRNCGLPDEVVFHGASQFPEDPGYFATIIVKG